MPIIALTAHIDTQNKQECIASGMDAILSKPLLQNTAEDIISAFISFQIYKDEHKINDKTDSFFASTGKVIDHDESLAKMGDDLQAAEEMMVIFVTGLKEDMPNLLDAKGKNNWLQVESIVHKF